MSSHCRSDLQHIGEVQSPHNTNGEGEIGNQRPETQDQGTDIASLYTPRSLGTCLTRVCKSALTSNPHLAEHRALAAIVPIHDAMNTDCGRSFGD